MNRLVLSMAALLLVSLLAGPAFAQHSARYELRGNDVVLPLCQVVLLEEARLTAQEPGLLASLEVREGKLVRAGQEIARLDDSRARMERDHSSADLSVAVKRASNDVDIRFGIKNLGVAQAEYERAIEANRIHPGTITPTELRRLRLAAERAELELEQARHEQIIQGYVAQAKQVAVDIAQQTIDRHGLKSPLTGMVVERYQEVGEWLDVGDPVVRIVRLDKLRVQGFLNVRDFNTAVVGSQVTVEVMLAGGQTEQFRGVVSFASPEVEPVTGDFRVWAEVENTNLWLQPGMTATMIVHLNDELAAKAAAGALQRRQALTDSPGVMQR
jgi:multidrug efflux pump subunit AcrA (membrane-fusion protein)